MNDSGDGRDRAPIDPMQPEAILESYRNWMTRAEEIHRAMIGAMQQTQDSGWDFAIRMAQCREPERAVALCNEWLNERRNAFFEDGRRIYELMFKMWQIDVTPPSMRKSDERD
jgi:hypothetical protein